MAMRSDVVSSAVLGPKYCFKEQFMISSILAGLFLTICMAPVEADSLLDLQPSKSESLQTTCCIPATLASGGVRRPFETEGVKTFVAKLFDTGDFPARWYCGVWSTDVGWLHILSDLGIFTAYFAIPCVLLFFILRKKDLPFPKVIWLFAAFILACGLGHLIEASIFWWPVYRFSGLVKCLTAIVSWVTVIVLVRIMPIALRLPSSALLATKLLKSQERLDIALGAAKIGVLEMDFRAQQAVADAKTRAIFGWEEGPSCESFLAIQETVHPDDRKRFSAALQAAVDGRTTFETEFRIVQSNGAIRFVQYQGRFVEEPGSSLLPEPGLLIGVCVDITEKHTKDAALSESEQNFRGTFENAAIGIAQVSVQGRWMKVNPILCSILGYSDSELLQMSSQTITYFEDLEKSNASMHAAIDGAMESYCLEKRFVRKDGHAVWVRLSASLVRDSSGEPKHFVKVIEDIDCRKQTELELQQYHDRVEKLSLVASKTQHSVVITDAEGKIEWCNEAFVRLTGFETNSVIGRKPGEFLQGELTDPEAVTSIREALRARVSIATEIVNYHASGRPYWIELKIDPVLDEAGNLSNFIATQVDISDRKRSEENLQQAKQAAEQASKAKSEFLAAMSHELRTPLNGVIGMTELLSDTGLEPRQQRFVDACRKSGQNLLVLINDILDFSKIESGKLELDSHPFDLLQLIRESMELIGHRAEEKDLQLRLRFEHPSPLCLLGDSHRIRQVLTNLLSNAVKFTDEGLISIIVDPVEATEERAQVRVRVKDTGIGIPADRLRLLFKEFSQVDQSASRRFNGTGLGLSISKSIIEAMGGSIGVKSTEGFGSEFWFQLDLPLGTFPEIAPPTDDQANPIPSRVLHILLAEDNPTNQMFAEEVITRHGWVCEVVDNGKSAVETYKRSKFDVLLMDCQMPDMDGFAATAAIREFEQSTHAQTRVPIIALTANAIQGDRERCLAAGMDAYLSKPFTPKSLLEEIESVIKNRPSDESHSDLIGPACESCDPPDSTFNESAFLEERCMGEMDFAVSLLDSFLATSSDRLRALIEHVQSGDFASASAFAHSLKGSAGVVLASRLAQLAEKVEMAAQTEDRLTMTEGLEQLVREVHACHRSIGECKHRILRQGQAIQETRQGVVTDDE
ncbi:Aerobic respiration control sensor protein ArcB [Pirellula sp. SH-Sr6A]|nr:Aerobic respiration control sensor protein ArcB [Pirellula sp. SH-Sr6A]